MTPKEKAKELVEAYLKTDFRVFEEYVPVSKEMAKECALTAVDKILSMGIISESGDWHMAKSYWQEVRQEIENL